MDTCEAPFTSCGGVCVDTRSTREHCGQCGVSCRFDQRCVSGFCLCEQGALECGGVCRDIQSDVEHCGGCDIRCGTLQVCVSGTCRDDCPDGRNVCGNACVDLQTDALHCGTCDNACPGNQSCASGSCTCEGDLTACGTQCVDTLTDDTHCGTCGTTCPADRTCSGGTCVCRAGLTECDGACIDVQSSDAHCGACGNACSPDRICTRGDCVCPDGFTDCSGDCVDTLVDEAHCGGCGAGCATGETCFSGACASCAPGELPCGDACVDPAIDPDHCGGCDIRCDPGETCLGGECRCDPDHLAPNHNASQATRLPIGDLRPGAGRGGALSGLRLCPGADDWYRLEIPGERGEVVVELSGDCTQPSFNPVIEVVNESGSPQASASSGGASGCPRLATRLGRNTRYLRVRSPDGTPGLYHLAIHFDELQERESNDVRSRANGPYHRAAILHGRLDDDWGDSTDFFRFDLHFAGEMRFFTSNCIAWNNIEVQNSSGSRQGRASTSSGCSTWTGELDPGTYYVRVTTRFFNEWGTYRLNFVGGPVTEVEPNNTPATATPLGTPRTAGEGALTRDDVDHWRITLTETTNLHLQTRGTFHPCETDTTLELRSADGQTLLAATSAGGATVHGGTGTCAVLRASTHPALQNLPAGDYIVTVRGTDGARGPYLLNVMRD
ncbi:MAG: hypothetical protein EA398_03050 [Deltaproteobacteria bacterium]|nr:MAG: hypothetical protein EA398_03050 [Deltaproteobacteria bacterium]